MAAAVEEMNNDPLPTLPIDLVAEIFCRLPVKLLVQLQCMCKSWNSLISDRSFTRKHLSLSTTRRIHYATYEHEPYELIHDSYPLDSVLSTKIKQKRTLPFNSIVASCDGILCLCDKRLGFVLLWNPSIRKSNELPPFENNPISNLVYMTFGFGYDRVSDNYKVVVLYYNDVSSSIHTTRVKVHALGTNSWKTSETFPFGAVCDEQPGTFLRATNTINWTAYSQWTRNRPLFIVSFDLGNDSYHKLLPPHHAEINPYYLRLSVLRDCLCLISDHHVWLMKEYGVQHSWTKLFSVSYMQHPSPTKEYTLHKVVYVFENDRLLLETHENSKRKLVLYDPKNHTFKVTRFTNILNVSLETLISPCS